MKTRTSTAFIVRVSRSMAGREIPFDKIYLFRRQDQHRLPLIFKSAMVFPMTKRFVSQIECVLKDYGDVYKTFPYFRGCHVGYANVVESLQKNRNEFVALVPVLFTREGHTHFDKKKMGRKKEASFPTYLIAQPGTDSNIKILKKALSSHAYFISDGKIIRPICLMCPLHQKFLQGQCHLGERNCYEYMARAKPADMVRGVRLYQEMSSTIQEPILDL